MQCIEDVAHFDVKIQHLFPLLWLLLRRDFEIFRLCRNTVIHKDELWDSADTIVWVFDAINQRHDDLQGVPRNYVQTGTVLIDFLASSIQATKIGSRTAVQGIRERASTFAIDRHRYLT